MLVCAAIRAGGRVFSTNPQQVIVCSRAVTGAKLSQSRAVGTRETPVGGMDWRSGTAEDVGVLTRADGTADIVGMQTILNVVIVLRLDDAIDQVRVNVVSVGRQQSTLHVTRACRRGNDRV